jgi:hypothetical protein
MGKIFLIGLGLLYLSLPFTVFVRDKIYGLVFSDNWKDFLVGFFCFLWSWVVVFVSVWVKILVFGFD